MVFRSILFILFSLVIVSCGWRKRPANSIVVIAVESLGFESLPCDVAADAASLKSMGELCDESIRFTHALTPSALSQPNLASLLTGLYPFEHKLWHNGNQFLSAKFTTVAEQALAQGFRTSFFSGGPPIWRRSGLHQGFEVFDDHVRLTYKKYYRTVSENFDLFLSWFKNEASGEPVFSVIYLPDLQFPDAVTLNSLGETRSRTYDSQLREIDESLGRLMAELKESGQWDQMNVFLVGLNGRTTLRRAGELPAYNLYAENTQVALLIKPARKKRDEAIHWKIDKNISLVDVGATLFSLIGKPMPRSGHFFEVVDLSEVFTKPETSWNDDRYLLLESGWPQWRGVGSSRFGVRQGHHLVIYDDPPKVYNTLVDRQEISPLSPGDPLWDAIYGKIDEFLTNRGYAKWTPVPDSIVEKVRLGQTAWREAGMTGDQFAQLLRMAENRPWDRQLWGWLAQYAIKKNDWALLLDLAKKASDNMWTLVAQKNLNTYDSSLALEGCGQLMLMSKDNYQRPNPQQCDDPVLISLINWVFEADDSKKLNLQEVFLSAYARYKIYEDVAKLNLINSLEWDVAVDLPGEISFSDLYLLLPENKKYRSITNARLQKLPFVMQEDY